MLKTKGKEKILKTAGENKVLQISEPEFALTQTTPEKPWRPEESEMKTVSDKGKLKEFVPRKPPHTEVLKFRIRGKNTRWKPASLGRDEEHCK